MRSGSVLNVEASDLAILKAKDVHHRLVLQPVRLILQRLAFEIADGLLDLHDDRAICGLGETHRLDMRADNSPLAGPILSDGLKPMNMATIHAVGPSYVVGQHSKNAVDVPCIEAVIDALQNLDVVSQVVARPKGFEPPTPRFVVWCYLPTQLRSPRHSPLK